MRRILCILLLLLCGLTPAQKKVLLQGSQDYEQLIRQHQPTLWLDGTKSEIEPLRHFTMDDNAASTAVVDASANGNGTLNENTSVISVAGGKIGRALDFDGADSVINIGADVIGTGDASITAWVYVDGGHEGGAGQIVSNGTSQLYLVNAGTLAFRSDGATTAASSLAAVASSAWVHVSVSRSAAGTANIYVNGALSGAANQASGVPGAPAANTRIGNNAAGSSTFNGKLDDIRIYDRALTPAEVSLIYNNGVGHQSQSVGKSTGNVVIDASTATVSGWDDKSGNGRFFSQPTAANQPSLTRYDNLENRILYSEDVSKVSGTAQWVYTRTENISATEFKEDGTAGNSHAVTQTTVPILSGQNYILEASLKRGTGTRNAKIFIDGGTGNPYFVADLSNCTMNDATGWVTRTISVDPVDATYCRVYLNLLANGTEAAALFRIYMTDAAFATTYNGDNTSSIHLTRVLWRSSLASSTYLATTTFPQYRGINGRSAVRFDGAASYMTTGGVWASIMSNSAKTIIAAMRTNPTAVTKPLLGMQSSAFYFYVNDSSQFVAGNYDGAWDILTNTSPTTSAAKASIAVMVHDGTTLRSWLDNGPKSSAASGDTNSLAATQAQLGTINASLFYNGEAGELLIFNKSLPDDVTFKIQKGLCKKWGASC